VVWLSEREISERLRELREDPSRWRRPSDDGQFSLGGAQGKTALFCEGNRWGLPQGRRPTTHILKPPLGDLDGHVENEHFCLRLARAAGLPTAASQVQTFGEETAIVVERYDRIRSPMGIARVHQEDMCQALGVHPASKYQSDGGPGPGDVAALLRSLSTKATDDVLTLVGALAFNWVVAGTDAHAKNHSLLIGRGGRARLAPLYDLASALPYPDIDPRRMKLAMKIGGKYRVHEIGAYQWDKLADEIALSSDEVRNTLMRMTHGIAKQAPRVLAELTDAGLTHPLLARLSNLVVERARACERSLR
jgi:serine/threonine-protein kinase HipA